MTPITLGYRDMISPGTRLGAYEIIEPLGSGGTGTVYLAYDSKLHRRIALKMMTSSTETETSRLLLLREARNAAALNHPNICTIYEVGEADRSAFIAMEYVEGRSLRDRIDSGVVAMQEAIRCGVDAAEALAYAHEHGVVHRDFKAANAIVTKDGRLKIVDFGLARR
jgi:serine/threonine protein kinase